MFGTLRVALTALTIMPLGLATAPALAQDHGGLPHHHFSFEGTFGAFDMAAVQRGFQVYRSVCANCHSMRLLSYRNLREIGLSEEEVRAIAASVQVPDGPNDEGQMFERPGRASDHFRSPFPNERAARAANNGALPPDLSVIVKAREGGAQYVNALLTGYREPPAGVTVMPGMNYNAYFAGNQIGMAPPLAAEGQVDYADHTTATVPQMASDVANFLAWAAEPELEARKRMGIRVLLFLAILAGLAYATKRKVWASAH